MYFVFLLTILIFLFIGIKGNENLLCNKCDWNTVEGRWIYDLSDSGDCIIENTDAESVSILWFGSQDGLTPDLNYIAGDDEFIFTVDMELYGDIVGILFSAVTVSRNNNIPQHYYFGLNKESNNVVFGKFDNGWNRLDSLSYTIDINVRYILKVEAIGSRFNMYIDDNKIFNNIILPDYTTGSIGLRAFAPAKYYSITLEDISHAPTRIPTRIPTPVPTDPTPIPTPQPTVFDACVDGNGFVEFGIFIYNEPELALNKGYELISSLDELLEVKSEFISFYNNNGGLTTIDPFGITNCCVAFGDDTYLTISSPSRGESYKNDHIIYPSYNSNYVCSSWPGYLENKYQLYRPTGNRNLNILNSDDIFSTTDICGDDNNPGIYKRYC